MLVGTINLLTDAPKGFDNDPRYHRVGNGYSTHDPELVEEAMQRLHTSKGREPRMDRNEEITIRMLGDNVTFTRYQWEYLLEELAQESDLRVRIVKILGL